MKLGNVVGMVGWRGMVGSVLTDRMRTEGDFALIEPVFFSTSNVGGPAPAVAGADERPDLFLEVATTILRFYARIAIVARSGVTSVVLRADNAGPHTVGSSAGKAFASATPSLTAANTVLSAANWGSCAT